MKLKQTIFLLLFSLAAYCIASSCGVSYKFNNAKLDYSVYKTIALSDFPNQAPLVYPPLYQEFNEKLKDAFSRQTRLQIIPQNGDYNIAGAIVGYSLQQMSVGTDGLAAETRLTLTIRVNFANARNSTEDFDRTFSAYKTFSSSTSFDSVQGQLTSDLVDEIIDQIFNATVASW